MTKRYLIREQGQRRQRKGSVFKTENLPNALKPRITPNYWRTISSDKKKKVQEKLNWKAVKTIEILLCKICNVVCPVKAQLLPHLASWRHKNLVLNQKPQFCRDCRIKFYSARFSASRKQECSPRESSWTLLNLERKEAVQGIEAKKTRKHTN